MSKNQHGNKEAKKPKQKKSLTAPALPGAAMPVATSVVPDRLKKKGASR